METLLLAAGLGLAAGLSPGPLLALVLSSTLERGFGAGLRVAVAPLLTDLLMLLLVFALLQYLTSPWLQGIGLVGGLVVIWIGVQTLRGAAEAPAAKADGATPPDAKADLWKGAAVNLLNPHAWLFWVAVGGPTVSRTWPLSPLRAIGFFLLFELFIVGSKVVLAGAAARARDWIRGPAYLWTLRCLGVLLVIFGIRLIAGALP